MPKESVELIEKLRWSGSIRCPGCWGLEHGSVSQDSWKKYKCNNCNYTFSVISDTFFHNTKLTPDQVLNLLNLHQNDQLQRRPSDLCKEIKVHHWTMTKLIRKIYGVTILDILNAPTINIFMSILNDAKVEISLYPYFQFMYVYKIMNLHDPKPLKIISGLNSEEVSECLKRISECWLPGEAFNDKDTPEWFDMNTWEKDTIGASIAIHLHAMCLSGTVIRNPETETYNAKR